MNLNEMLAEKKKEILSIWIDRTLDSYSSSEFFKRSADRFANPVGMGIREGLTRLFELLLEAAPAEAYLAPLDKVMRIRAVQDFTPANALAPILELKWVTRQVLKQKSVQVAGGQLDRFDCDVDRMALMAFDCYVQCREMLYRNRIGELKSGRHMFVDNGCPSALLKKENSTAS
ncbi:MAG: hypothetical protein CSA34_00210 [Desulfobulbus propionicus]|nr:MAG: hypothetical protein CSA34_00210 [Desulfobulbus propionicus]